MPKFNLFGKSSAPGTRDYQADIAKFTQYPFRLVTIAAKRCELTYATGACTAVNLGPGLECFNTSGTCQKRADFSPGLYTGDFYVYDGVSPRPILNDVGLRPELPTLLDVKYSTASLNTAGGIGIRGGCTITIQDHPHDDRNVDPYYLTRTNFPNQKDYGTYWSKFISRNKHYQGEEIRVYEADIENGVFDTDKAKVSPYIIEDLQLKNGKVTIKCRDVLKRANDERAQYPAASKATIAATLTTAPDQTMLINPPGIMQEDDFQPKEGFGRIGSEIVWYKPVVGDPDSVIITTRGNINTVAEEHEIGSTLQPCFDTGREGLASDGWLLNDILYQYLRLGADIPAEYMDGAQWAREVQDNYNYKLSGIITEPVGVDELIKELSSIIPFHLWWDENLNKVRLTITNYRPGDARVLTREDNLLSEPALKDRHDLRISQVRAYYGQVDPTKALDDASNYSSLHVRADLGSESINQYREPRYKTVFSRWWRIEQVANARKACEFIGRNYADTPKEISFEVSPKDNNFNLTDPVTVMSNAVVNFDGTMKDEVYRVTSIGSGSKIKMKAISNYWGAAIEDDTPEGTLPVYITGNIPNAEYDRLYMFEWFTRLYDYIPLGTEKIVFIIESGSTVTSTTTEFGAIVTGTTAQWLGIGWDKPIHIEVLGKVRGRGGQGGGIKNNLPLVPTFIEASDGGDAITVECDIELDVTVGSVHAGAGGGGASAFTWTNTDGSFYRQESATGGGGAVNGIGGDPSNLSTGENGVHLYSPGGDAVVDTGGRRAQTTSQIADVQTIIFLSGEGGNSGEDGNPGVGTIDGEIASDAINRPGGIRGYSIFKEAGVTVNITGSNIKGRQN